MLVIQSVADLPYVAPFGTPLYWKDDQSGIVAGSIWAYICHCARPQEHPEPPEVQLRLVVQYLKYYIHAPCWEHSECFAEELARLRSRIEEMAAAEVVDVGAVRRWVSDCLGIAIDPL